MPVILFYPTAKRWFAYPQALLAICWGFAVLIPWAANEASLAGGFPLLFCWGGKLFWTFGFDTVYAMADRHDDAKLGLHSSALSLGEQTKKTVAISYAISSICLALGAYFAETGWIFWPIWIFASLGMQHEVNKLRSSVSTMTIFGRHFKNQVWIGGLILLGLIIGRIN